ncbi:uncharacterized protein LOC128220139 [Mya arenaria]|uniref:uncharacterized protein LOC128220139 n=1 Tax=Mya arenaria TaxID=6604 RepID=UPI0022E4CE24|nr:uncharacterized protein LOC128220139 [Mya arenaria]
MTPMDFEVIESKAKITIPEMRFTLEEELNPTCLFTFICRERDFIQLCNNYRLNVVDSEDLFEQILDSLQDVKQSGLRVRPLLFETMKTVAHLKLPNLEIRWRPACKTRVAQHNKMRQEEKEADRKRLERKCRNQRGNVKRRPHTQVKIETMEAMRVEMDRMRAEIAELREEVRSLKEGANTCTAPSTEMAEQSRIPRPKGPASASAHRSLFAAVRRRPGFAAGSASTTSTACRTSTTTASTTARSTSARSTAATVGSSTRKTTSARSSAATAPSMSSAGGQTSAPSTSSAGGQTVEGGAARGRGKVSTKRKRVDDDGGQAKKKPAWK